jgi:hypothetical protein
MSETTFRNIARAISTRYDIEQGKRLIPNAKISGEFKVLHKKPNVLMRLVYRRDIQRMNKDLRTDAWGLLKLVNERAPQLAVDVNKAAVFVSRHDCSKLSATGNRQLAKDYRLHLNTLVEAEKICFPRISDRELNELGDICEQPV